ncbi:MAG: NADH-quinone oxidoreductase subunit NuoG, partial [Casimicrobiaceae bacterium]
AAPEFFAEIPPAFAASAEEFRVVPLHHIFGSEELSVLSPGIAELAARPYLALNADDAGELGLSAGDMAQLHLDNTEHDLPVRLEPGLQRGIAGLPVGLPGAVVVPLPALARVKRGGAR